MSCSLLYKEIFEPENTVEPLRFADRSLMITREGEIRLYGCRTHEHDNGEKSVYFVVMKSKDNGLSFTIDTVPDSDPGARVASPWNSDYLTVISSIREISSSKYCKESHIPAAVQLHISEPGTYVYRSSGGADGPWQAKRISPEINHLQRLPLPLKKWKRWIVAGQRRLAEDSRYHPVVLLGDAEGENWSEQILPAPPVFEIHYPHKGMRWFDPGVEPVIAETASGRLIMLLRTSMDVHYECFSEDGGLTWSEMRPSIFYAVATMPGLYTMSDGRMVAIWNNTAPLPELDHTTQILLEEREHAGLGEDVFTNRDVLHAAISEDEGRTWHGFREVALNPLRNNSDFRTDGGSWYLKDKSVHQNQLIELPDNKVLLHCGQHLKSSQLILFDLDYLYKRERSDDFTHGLKNFSTHLYYKSLSGGCRIAGHCAWNRRSGAQLMPSPENDWREALLIGRHPDERLFSDREGAVWNFPGCRTGVVNADFTINAGTAGLRITLTDRWFNPCDEFVAEQSPFSFVLDGAGKIGSAAVAVVGERCTLAMEFDLNKGLVQVSGPLGSVEIPYSRTILPPFGTEINLSYLHLQSAAVEEDNAGVFLHCVNMKMI